MVSVIIPTYNRSTLLKEAVLSVYEQSYRPIECIVIDDGSTDDSANVMNELGWLNNVDFKLHYIVQTNAGSQVARNRGTAAANGDYIQYLDSDDLLYPDKLASQVTYLTTHPDCNGVFGDWEKGEPQQKEMNKAYVSENMYYQLLTEKPIANFSFLMRRSLIQQIGDWDITIKRNQEIDYHLRGLLAGAVYHYLPGVTGLWRTHEGERIFSKTNFSSAISFYRKWEQVLKEKGLWSLEFQQGFVSNYMWFLGSYPQSAEEEMMSLMKEVYRLQPSHPIFQSWKFRLVKFTAGINKALQLWVRRYSKAAGKA